MSYEGYTERLCINGHYSAHDVYCDGPTKCPHCGGAYRYSHGVDQTNGYDEDCEYSCGAPKREIGHEDVWHEDHLGNRYATKLLRYEPLGDGIWVKVNSRGHATPPYEDDLGEAA